MEELIDLEDLLSDINEANVAMRVIGYAGISQQADEVEMGQALQFVSRALDGVLTRANQKLDDIRGKL